MKRVPEERVARLNELPVRAKGRHVLYWMVAARRSGWSFPLQRAVEWALELDRPLVVLEALRSDYRWASDRLHRFVIDGMADNAAAFAGGPVAYHPYVEPERGHGKGLLAALAEDAAVVVTDEFPCFFLPAMTAAAAKRLPVLLEAVDGNGLLPLRATEGRVFPTAFAFRGFLQKHLPEHLGEAPKAAPLRGLTLKRASLPRAVTTRWPAAAAPLLRGGEDALAVLPIDHSVPPSPIPGGSRAGAKALRRFVAERLPRYGEGRNDLDDRATSELSPYLHFGHVSAHAVFAKVAASEAWTPAKLADRTGGKRRGWWGMSEPAEGFLDQLVTWRELGFNYCFNDPEGYARYDSLPAWARQTLAEHAGDERLHLYNLDELELAETHDELWNAAQRELVETGLMHNYLRMLWGKKILEWSATPADALETMIELNNRYALDGRDPNSYSGIFWILGRYDRAWGPERPIFGKIRYMSSANTARKLRVKPYLARFGGSA